MKRPIKPENLYGYRWPSQPSIAPDGRIAYVEQTIDRDSNGYTTTIRRIDSDGTDRPLAAGGKDTAPAWSPDGGRLAFLRTETGGKGLWIQDGEEEDPSPLIAPESQLQQFVWSPDGKYIAFIRKTGATPVGNPLRGKSYSRTAPRAEGSGWWDGRYSHLFLCEVSSGNVKQLTDGEWDVTAPAWSPAGEALAFVSKQADPALDADLLSFSDIYTVPVSGGQPCKLTVSTLLIEQIAYSRDGRLITLLASDRLYGSGSHQRLYTVPAAGGTPELLAAGLDVQLGNAALSDMKSAAPSRAPQPDPADPELAIYVPGTRGGNVDIYRIDAQGVSRRVTWDGEKDVYQYVVSPDGSQLVTAALTDRLPGELYRTDLRTGKVTRLTRLNDEHLSGLKVNIPERFSFNASDGWEIEGWIMQPDRTAVEAGQEGAGVQPADGVKLPLILQIHGGPHAMYTGTFSHELQSLAAEGYAVLWVNPRGSMGYGQEFARACRGDVCGGDYRDLMEAVDEALRRYPELDAKRLGVGGGSYGGLMTNWIISQTLRFRAAVSHRCISNWISLYGTSDIGISYVEGVAGGNPVDHHELLWSRSPLAHVKDIVTPLLLLHGEADFRTPIGQAEELYTALKRDGKTVRLIRYPGSNHAMLKSGKPSLRVDSLEQVNAWFARYLLGDPAEEAPATEPLLLSIPVGMMLENLLSGGASAEEVISGLKNGRWQQLLLKAKEPDMDVPERLQTAAELNEDWERALREGYAFKYLHINGVKRLLLFRFGRSAERDYVQEGTVLRGLSLEPWEMERLQTMIRRQWLVTVEEADGAEQSITVKIELQHVVKQAVSFGG